MDNKKWIIKILSVILVILSIGIELGYIIIPGFNKYRFWVVVISFISLFFSTLK